MDYCAEVSYIRCNNGYKLPMEIAFACVNNPRQVFILHMRMPHDVHFTVADLVCNKSQCVRIRNKAYNVHARCILKMDKESWWHTLQHFIQDQMGWDVQLAVRSKNQKQFFKMMGGFRNICIVKPPEGNHAYGCIHSHNRLISFPCAAKAARTLAVNLNRTHLENSKKAIQCLGLSEVMDQCPMDKSNEEKPRDKLDEPMDKLDEHKLLEAIDKLLKQCDELMDQYPGEDKSNETLEPMDKSNESLEPKPLEPELMDKSNETLDKSNESLEPKPLEPELVDKSNETLDKSNESVELKPLEPELMDTSNETLEQELMDHCLMDTTNEEKPLKPMDKSNEEKPLEHCDGEGCREAVYKSVEYCPKESLNYVDKSMVENTNKEFIVELMKRVNEAMECSDPDIVTMECCEELLSNVEIILDEKATELENVEVDKKEVNVERAQPEKAMESNVDHDEK